MPFVLSHTAAVLPLLKRSKAGGWRTSLVFGSVAPDLWVAVPFLGDRAASHGLPGLFFNPLAAVLLAWIFLRWFAPRLSRLPGTEPVGNAPFDWGRSLLAAMLGVLTHLAWDSFTHAGHGFLAHPFFSTAVYSAKGTSISIAQCLWLFNSVVGLLVVLWWTARRLGRRGESLGAFMRAPWPAMAALFLLPFLALALYIQRPTERGPGGFSTIFWYEREVRATLGLALLAAAAAAWWGTRTAKAATSDR